MFLRSQYDCSLFFYWSPYLPTLKILTPLIFSQKLTKQHGILRNTPVPEMSTNFSIDARMHFVKKQCILASIEIR